jgi:anti-sigma B factor antagonist
MTLVAVGDQLGDEGVPTETGLVIEAHDADGWTVVAFVGELDLDEAGEAASALAAAVGRGHHGVIADLRGVTFLGSTGIRVLLEAQTAAEAAGGRLRVVQGDGPARRLIELLGLGERLGVADDGS